MYVHMKYFIIYYLFNKFNVLSDFDQEIICNEKFGFIVTGNLKVNELKPVYISSLILLLMDFFKRNSTDI